ncbi:hypothetical protein H0H92_008694 [Tricholoma furcatifolium]|nr:hypothetical protein H0H92_008694 [Tricholoma furcatifolium]
MVDKEESMYKAKESGGSVSLLGFRFSGGVGVEVKERVETRFDDVEWVRERTMALAPTAGQVYLTILGDLAQRFHDD